MPAIDPERLPGRPRSARGDPALARTYFCPEGGLRPRAPTHAGEGDSPNPVFLCGRPDEAPALSVCLQCPPVVFVTRMNVRRSECARGEGRFLEKCLPDTTEA